MPVMASAYVPWNDFYTALVSHVGEKRAVAIFCEETDFNESSVYVWKRQDRVPADAMARVNEIDLEIADSVRFKGFHSQRFFKRVVELSNVHMPIRDIARTLTNEFGRKITIGAVKSARFRFKDQIPGYRTRGATPAEFEAGRPLEEIAIEE